MPWRSRAVRIAEGERDAANLRMQAAETMQVARLLSLRQERDRLVLLAADLEAAAARIERRTRELREEVAGG